MQSSVRSLADSVLKTGRRVGRRPIVGVSGIDCAGKTTLAGDLATELRERGEDVVVIGGDDFNRPSPERSTYPAEESHYGFDYAPLALEVLAPAREGGAVVARLRVKDWQRDAWDERGFRVEPPAIVLVEGVFLFTPELRPLFDLAIWLDISFDNALTRAVSRDGEAMGGPEGVRKRYSTRYFPAQRLHLERDRPRERADLVLVVLQV